MADLARSQGLHTMVGLQGRFAPAFRRVKELLDEGYVGEVLACHLSQIRPGVLNRTSGRTWQRDRTLGATTLTIPFGHAVDCMCMCVGEFSEVSAVVSTQVPQWHETDTDRMVDVTAPDNILVSGRLANGAVASVHVASVPWHGSSMRLEVYGREGTLVASTGLSAQIDPVRLEGGRGTDRTLQELPIPDRLTAVPPGVPDGEPLNVARMYQGLADAIRTGKRVEPDFATAVTRHKLIDAVQAASDQGRAGVSGAFSQAAVQDLDSSLILRRCDRSQSKRSPDKRLVCHSYSALLPASTTAGAVGMRRQRSPRWIFAAVENGYDRSTEASTRANGSAGHDVRIRCDGAAWDAARPRRD